MPYMRLTGKINRSNFKIFEIFSFDQIFGFCNFAN